MAWVCYMVEVGPEGFFTIPGKTGFVHFNDLKPGAMWWEDSGHTELMVKLPSNSEWNIDRGRIINAQRPGQATLPQWIRTGEPPKVTAHPSINHVGQYHGFLKAGILTDDCEGRKFSV